MSVISRLIARLYCQHCLEESIFYIVVKVQEKGGKLYLVILSATLFGNIHSNKILFCSAMTLCTCVVSSVQRNNFFKNITKAT